MSESLLRALLAAHDRAAGPAVLKQDGRVRVSRVPYDERGDAVVKEDRGRGVRSRLGQAVRGSRAARSERTARALAALGVPVPEPVGVIAAPGRVCYVARHVAGPTLSEALGHTAPGEQRTLALQAVDLAATLHLAGFVPRDLKPPNLIVRADGALVLVDLDDVRRGAPPRGALTRRQRRALAALDAYGQLTRRPLGVRLRWEALFRYGDRVGVDARGEWRAILARSREKRRRIAARA